jgi:hypothetical protein
MIVASTYPQDERIERIARPRAMDSQYFSSYNQLVSGKFLWRIDVTFL